MKTTLFKINTEYLEIISQLVNNGGELTEELEQSLEVNRDQLETKAESYIYIIRELEAKANAANEEIKRLQGVKKSIQATQDRLKDSLLNALMLYGSEDNKGVKRLEIGLNKLSTRKSSQVIITDEAIISEDFAKWSKSVDKTAIKKALSEGGEIEGAELITNLNLSIK